MADQLPTPHYPFLEEMLALRGMSLQATYSIRDFARLFSVSTRAVQDWVVAEHINSRYLPGRARFLPTDIEEFLRGSKRKKK